uniref:Transposase n=1 Tax=Heterorhabditis bacteriophora TaxID=37862 RepID=A0A1I7WIB4_HETBA
MIKERIRRQNQIGHSAQKQGLSSLDALIDSVDARTPLSSHNPAILAIDTKNRYGYLMNHLFIIYLRHNITTKETYKHKCLAKF